MRAATEGTRVPDVVAIMDAFIPSVTVPFGTPDPKGDEVEELTANRTILEQEAAFDKLNHFGRRVSRERPGMLRRAGQNLRYVLREMKLGFFNFWK